MKYLIKNICLLCLFFIFYSNASITSLQHDNFYANVSYLRWRAQEDQLQYAVFLPQGVLPANTRPFIESFNFVNQAFEFDNGVRLDIGTGFCTDWDACVSWTHFKQRSCSGINSTEPQHILATPISQFAGPVTAFSTAAQGLWRLDYNTIDITLGQWYQLSPCTNMKVYLGILAAKIKQRQNINLGEVPAAPDLVFVVSKVNRCNTFAGAGPELGVDFVWNYRSHWALFGKCSGALLVGKFDTSIVNFLSDSESAVAPSCCTRVPLFPSNLSNLLDATNDPTFSAIVSECKQRVRAHIDCAVGLEWNYCFCDWLDLQASISFEINYWPEQWQCVSSVFNALQAVLPSSGNLTTYGTNFSFGFGF